MSKKEERIRILSEENVSTALLKLGLPTIIGMLTSALYNVVDAYFISWLGPSQMAGVSIAFPVVQVVIGLGLTFGTGAASCISRHMGAGNTAAANRTASSALLSSIVTGIAITCLSLFFMDEILVSLGASGTVLPHAREYFTVFILFSTVSICYIAVNSIAISEGASRMSMLVMLFGGVLNILLDPVFIFTFGLGVQGAAIATAISQLAMLAIFFRYFSGSGTNIKMAPGRVSSQKDVYIDILKIGLPMFAFQLLSGVSMGMTNTAISQYGDAAVASMGVALRVLALVAFVIFGFVKGFQPIAGYSYGAGNVDRLKEATAAALKWTGAYCVLVTVGLCFFNREIMGLFSHGNQNIVYIGGQVLMYNGLVFVLFGFFMVYSTVFLSLGKATEGMVLNLSRQGIFFIPAILILPRLYGLDGVIYAQPLAEALSFLLALRLYMPLKKKLTKMPPAPAALAPGHES